MDRNDCVKIIYLRIEIIVPKIVDHDRLVIRIYDPVFFHAGILVFVELEEHILGAGGRREDFQCKIRRTFKALRTQIVRAADHEEIRLHHSLVVPIQSYIARRQIDFALSFVGIGTLPKKNEQFAQYLLMYDGRCRHIVEHAVDQFDASLMWESIIVI